MTVRTLNTNPRPVTDEQRAWVASQAFWYSAQFPIDSVPGRRRGQRRNLHQPWFQRMVRDIEKNGLRSPILLNNSDVTAALNPFSDRPQYCVNAGNHRVMACVLLGWLYIPAIVWGEAPPQLFRVGPLTLDEVNQQYIKDGVLELAWHGPVLTGASDAREEFGA